MSNKLFQGVIYQMKSAVDRVIGILDNNGVIVACSELQKVGETRQAVLEELTYVNDVIFYDGYTFRPINQGGEYIIFVEGVDDEASKTSMILAVALSNIKSFHDEKYDKASFIKSVLMENILPGDIYVKSKELNLNSAVKRLVYLIKFPAKNDVSPFDIIQNMFPNKNEDYVIGNGENDIILVREMKSDDEYDDAEALAKGIIDTLSTEFYTKAVIGIGSPAENIKELARSFKEAQTAVDVGRIFEDDADVIRYEKLGIGRLIHQLPTTLCDVFLGEVFKKGSYELLDREILTTIFCFFENNLNVSETARKLFVHRNTLVYRLDKIHKLTGLDLREFDDAIIFKVALMVKKYLAAKSEKY